MAIVWRVASRGRRAETEDWQLHAPGQVFNEDPLNTTSREEIQLGISSMLAEMDNTGVDINE